MRGNIQCRKVYRLIVAAAAISVLVWTAPGAASANDAQVDDESVDSQIEAIASVRPDALERVAATVTRSGDAVWYTDSFFDPSLGIQVDEGSATLSRASNTVILEGIVGPSLMVEIESIDNASHFSTEGALSISNSAGISSLATIKDDASVQIISVIEGPEASEEIAYTLNGGMPFSAKTSESGSLALLDESGALLGFAATPWAIDARGADVPTRYEVRGEQLVQIVEHHGGGWSYPIVADPYMGKNLFTNFTYSVWPANDQKHSFSKSAYGASIHNPLNYWIFTSYGWDEFRARTPGQNSINTSVHQQFDCHAAGGYYDWAGATWDLEPWRPARANGNWFYGSAVHHCNWSTANGY